MRQIQTDLDQDGIYGEAGEFADAPAGSVPGEEDINLAQVDGLFGTLDIQTDGDYLYNGADTTREDVAAEFGSDVTVVDEAFINFTIDGDGDESSAVLTIRLEDFANDSDEDVYIGSTADDVFDGGAGNDTMTGRQGDDLLSGGGGNDTFVWRNVAELDADGDLSVDFVDTISDFRGVTEGDALDVSDLLQDPQIFDPGNVLDTITVIGNVDNNVEVRVDLGGASGDQTFIVIENIDSKPVADLITEVENALIVS